MVAPVTKPTLAVAGRGEQVEQPPGGHLFYRGHARRHHVERRILIQAETSQSAASAAGRLPPVTKPK